MFLKLAAQSLEEGHFLNIFCKTFGGVLIPIFLYIFFSYIKKRVKSFDMATVMFIIFWDFLMWSKFFFHKWNEAWLLLLKWHIRVATRFPDRLKTWEIMKYQENLKMQNYCQVLSPSPGKKMEPSLQCAISHENQSLPRFMVKSQAVTYGWHTSTHEWHTSDTRMTHERHTDDTRMTHEHIRVTCGWRTST